MSTATKSNTLPAIRALLWERWRVMRWIVPVILLLSIPGTVALDGMFFVLLDTPPRFLEASSLPMVLLLAFGLLMHPFGQKGYSIALPEHILRLPISTRKIASIQLGAVIVVVTLALLVQPLFSLDQGEFTRARGLPYGLGSYISGLAIAVGIYTLAALSRLNAVMLAFLITLLVALCMPEPEAVYRILLDSGTRDEFVLSPLLEWVPKLTVLVGSFPAATLLLSRARCNPRGSSSHSRPFQYVRSRSPRNNPFWARVWFEWRMSGRFFLGISIGLSVLIGAAQRAADEHADSYAIFSSFPVMLGAAAIASLLMSLSDWGRAGDRGGRMALLAPVPTRMLVLTRTVHALIIVAVSTLAIMLFEAGAAYYGGGKFGGADALLLLNILPWALIVLLAFVPVLTCFLLFLLSGLALRIVIGMLLAAGIIEGRRYLVISTVESYLYPMAITLLAAAAIGSAVYLSYRARIPARVWPLIALLGPAAFLFMVMIENPSQIGRMESTMGEFVLGALILVSIPVGVVAWQGLWLEYCRHGGLGWRLGGEKWGQ